MLSSPSPIQQASAVATALVDELAFPYQMRTQDKTRLVATLYDAPPSRKDLSFQTTTRTGNSKFSTTPKAAMGVEIADGPDLITTQNLYCMVHGDFTPVSGIDIEHGAPFSGIFERQGTWLRFLNDPNNQAFTQAFLQEKGVSDFFRKDMGKIKGTGYLYKICYNSVDNLWLVCHACNIEKSDKDLLTWFQEQDKHFGPNFIAHLQQKGGLKEGVLLPVVGGTSVAVLSMDGKSVDICSGGMGIGKFAREWFFEKNKKEFELQKQFYVSIYAQFKEDLAKINNLLSNGKTQEVKNEVRKLKKKLLALDATLRVEYPQRDSSSDSDTPSQEEIRKKQLMSENLLVDDKTYYLKKLEEPLQKKYPLEQIDIHKFVNEMLIKALGDVAVDDVRDFCEKIKLRLDQDQLPVWSILKVEMGGSLQSFQEKLALAQQEATEAKQHIATLDTRVITAESDIAAERARSQALASDLEEARARLAILQGNSGVLAPISSPSPSLQNVVQPPTTPIIFSRRSLKRAHSDSEMEFKTKRTNTGDPSRKKSEKRP